jgi:HK97 family phage major capsid protein
VFPVAFGDFSAGYLIVDLFDLRVSRGEITTPGQVKFYVRGLVGAPRQGLAWPGFLEASLSG